MFISPDSALKILEHYKYFIIFPITIIEGPIITVIGGFLVSIGYLNPVVAYSFLVIGDWIGDGLHYLLGKYYSKKTWFKKTAKYFGYNDEREKLVETHFKKHPGKTVMIAKASHGIGGLVQIVAGMSGMDFWEFMKYSFYATIPKTLTLFLVGYYIGSSYKKIDTYMDYVAYTVLVFTLLLVLYFIMRRIVKKEVIE